MRTTSLAFLALLLTGFTQPGATLEGTVTDAAGQPILGARVWALADLPDEIPPPATTSAADGSFSIPHLPPGEDLELWVCADGFLLAAETVRAGEEPMRVPIQVKMDPVAHIRGRVLGPDGLPLAGATVHVQPDGGFATGGEPAPTPCPMFQPETTDAEGRFDLDTVDPDLCEVTVEMPGLLHPGFSELVSAAVGESAPNLEIRMRRSAAVNGRVIDLEGKPVPGAEVWLDFVQGADRKITDAGGAFRIEGVGSRMRSLRISAKGYDDAQSEITLQDEEIRQVDVVLRPKAAER